MAGRMAVSGQQCFLHAALGRVCCRLNSVLQPPAEVALLSALLSEVQAEVRDSLETQHWGLKGFLLPWPHHGLRCPDGCADPVTWPGRLWGRRFSIDMSVVLFM